MPKIPCTAQFTIDEIANEIASVGQISAQTIRLLALEPGQALDLTS